MKTIEEINRAAKAKNLKIYNEKLLPAAREIVDKIRAKYEYYGVAVALSEPTANSCHGKDSDHAVIRITASSVRTFKNGSGTRYALKEDAVVKRKCASRWSSRVSEEVLITSKIGRGRGASRRWSVKGIDKAVDFLGKGVVYAVESEDRAIDYSKRSDANEVARKEEIGDLLKKLGVGDYSSAYKRYTGTEHSPEVRYSLSNISNSVSLETVRKIMELIVADKESKK
jgi:hypothetical protein